MHDLCAYFAPCYKCYSTPAVGGGALSDTAIRPSVCPTAQLPWAIGTLAACSLATCGLQTRYVSFVLFYESVCKYMQTI